MTRIQPARRASPPYLPEIETAIASGGACYLQMQRVLVVEAHVESLKG